MWLEGGMLGLGLLGSGFGAYSQQQAASRQRDLYNQYNQQRQLMQNPAYQISQAQPYYQANLAAMRQQLPTFMRTQVNPMLGIQGLDPAGGAARQITEQAIAPQIGQAWQNALGTVQGQNTAAMSGLSGMGQNIGQPYGQMGGLPQALQSVMMMQALNRYNPAQRPTLQGRTPQVASFSGTNTSQVPGSPWEVEGNNVSSWDYLEPKYYQTPY